MAPSTGLPRPPASIARTCRAWLGICPLRPSPGQVVPVPNLSRSSAADQRWPGPASHIAGSDERHRQALVVSGILAGSLLPGVEWLHADTDGERPCSAGSRCAAKLGG